MTLNTRRKREWLLSAALCVLVACAVITTGLLLHDRFGARGPSAPADVTVAGWQRIAAAGHHSGAPHPRSVVVVFSDFQCPYCAALSYRLDSLKAHYPADVEVVYRHFPLEIHRSARAAAEASECAARQGDFEAFRVALFDHQSAVGLYPWNLFAEKAGVRDTAAFSRCMDSGEGRDAIQKDLVAGTALGINSTPVMIINGTLIHGDRPLPVLEQYVRRSLANPA